MRKEFNVITEQDSEGYLIASVPEQPGCHTQAKTHDKLQSRIEEAIELYLEEDSSAYNSNAFVGIQRIAVE